MPVKKYITKKIGKLVGRKIGKKARTAAQKRALAKAVKISAMKRAKKGASKKIVKAVGLKTTRKQANTVLKSTGKIIGFKPTRKQANTVLISTGNVIEPLTRTRAEKVTRAVKLGTATAYLGFAGALYASEATKTHRRNKRALKRSQGPTLPRNVGRSKQAEKQYLTDKTLRYLEKLRKLDQYESQAVKQGQLIRRNTGRV